MIKVSTSAYPWDLANLGVDRVVDDLLAKGISGVDLAANYHPIDALTPRGLRFFTSGRGAVHFPARAERYGNVVPKLSAAAVCAAWPELVAKAELAGIEVAAWTITLFQPWAIDANPACARVLPAGDPSGTGLCPANADVREFMAAMCDGVVDQFGVGVVRLESVMPLGYDVDWLRARVLVDVPRLARELLTLCFCDTCVQRGTEAGLDVERLRGLVVGAIEAALDGGEGSALDGIGDDPELQEFMAQHERASLELVEHVAARLDGTGTRLSASIRTPFPTFRRGVNIELTERLARSVHQLYVAAAKDAGNERIVAIAEAAPHPIELTMLITRGLRFGASAAEDPPDRLVEQLEEAVALGVAEVSLYNYGLLRDADVASFMDAVRAASSV
jgi:hypothetical protein